MKGGDIRARSGPWVERCVEAYVVPCLLSVSEVDDF